MHPQSPEDKAGLTATAREAGMTAAVSEAGPTAALSKASMTPTQDHPLFESARLVVEYHLVRKPRVSLLEQTMGTLNEDVFDGVPQS